MRKGSKSERGGMGATKESARPLALQFSPPLEEMPKATRKKEEEMERRRE